MLFYNKNMGSMSKDAEYSHTQSLKQQKTLPIQSFMTEVQLLIKKCLSPFVSEDN